MTVLETMTLPDGRYICPSCGSAFEFDAPDKFKDWLKTKDIPILCISCERTALTLLARRPPQRPENLK